MSNDIKDSILYIDVGADVDNFKNMLEMYGSQDLLVDDSLRFFLASAVMHISQLIHTFDTINKVVTRIENSLRREFRDCDTTKQSKRLVDEWLFLTENIKHNIESYLYDHGKRNNRVATFQRYMNDGMIAIIIHEYDDEV